MTVTELALLQLKNGLNEKVKRVLGKAKKAMQDYSGRTFYYLQQIEDPACIYVLGEWESLEQHYDGFIPSKLNQDLLEELKDEIEISWLSHLDEPVSDIPLDASVLSLGRHIITASNREAFANCFAENKKFLDAFVTEGKATGGWKLDEGRENEEFVLLAPWKEVQQHGEFGKSEGFKEYFKIKEFIAEADIKHVKVLRDIE
jgi:quinol monooxygenase YgiN